MSDGLKACPVCGGKPSVSHELSVDDHISCVNPDCWLYGLGFHIDDWQNRPLEDALQARITELKETIEDIKELAELASVDAKTLQSALFHLSTIGIIANKAVKESENE